MVCSNFVYKQFPDCFSIICIANITANIICFCYCNDEFWQPKEKQLMWTLNTS